MSNFIGPTLPAHLIKSLSSEDEASNGSSSNHGEYAGTGPKLPPQLSHAASVDTVCYDSSSSPPRLLKKRITQSEDSTDELIGPALPPHLRKGSDKSEESSEIIGPSLPKNLQRSNSGSSPRSDLTGPALPPKLRTKLKARMSNSSDEEPTMIGPSLPPHLQDSNSGDSFGDSSVNISVIGPTLPPFLSGKRQRAAAIDRVSEDTDSPSIGPTLPAFLQSKLEEEAPTVVEDVNAEPKLGPVIGPSLPSHLKLTDSTDEEDDAEDGEAMYGPALPPGLKPKTVVVKRVAKKEVDSDDETVGPLPEGIEAGSEVQRQLELRARHLRRTMASGDDEPSAGQKRESWMLELPEDRAPELGLRPRQFRMRAGPEAGDRSVWTDTPEDRERKKRNPKAQSPDRGALERQAVQQRDEVMEQLAEKHSSKRGSRSLMDIHEEKLQAKRKKAEESGEATERRPFSREVDLQVNRFDEAQKRSILKKAQHLNDRFSSGQSKFL